MTEVQEFFRTDLKEKAMVAALKSAGFRDDDRTSGLLGYSADHTFCTPRTLGKNGDTRHGIILDLDVPPTELSIDHPVRTLFRNLGGNVVLESLIPGAQPKYDSSDYMI
jgi:hypothetical protein